MKHKEKEYLIAFKLYIDNYDSRYRYPKWIRAIDKKDAITKYIQIIKPDLTLGACIIMDERPVKQDETKEEEETETLQEEDVEEMVKDDISNVSERTSLEILAHEPIFDIESTGLDKGYAYLLEKIDDDGSVERKVIVIIDISQDRIDYIWRETAHDTVRREGTLTPLGFERSGYKLYPITAEDIK